MKTFKIILKFSWLISILLGVFYIGLGVWLNDKEPDAAQKSIWFGIFWFVMAYINKKFNKPNESYVKMGQACAYIYGKISDTASLTENRIMQILYLADNEAAVMLKKSLFPQAPWSYNAYLVNPHAEFWSKNSKMFAKLTAKGLNPSIMVPPKNFTDEELLVLDKVIQEVGEDSLFDIQVKVKNTVPVKKQVQGELNLVAINHEN